MKGFNVGLIGWYQSEDTNGNVLIENDEDALLIIGGYLCIGMDGKLKVAEPREGGMEYYDANFEYEIIRK